MLFFLSLFPFPRSLSLPLFSSVTLSFIIFFYRDFFLPLSTYPAIAFPLHDCQMYTEMQEPMITRSNSCTCRELCSRELKICLRRVCTCVHICLCVLKHMGVHVYRPACAQRRVLTRVYTTVIPDPNWESPHPPRLIRSCIPDSSCVSPANICMRTSKYLSRRRKLDLEC